MQRRHQTTASQVHEAAENRQYWEYQPGQPIMTIDGPGKVIAVHDGPFPGSEEYEITLRGGLGGGIYSTSQIVAAMPSEASTTHTAQDDYPELGNLLHERPDPATIRYTASLHTAMPSKKYPEHPEGFSVRMVPDHISGKFRLHGLIHGTPVGELSHTAFDEHRSPLGLHDDPATAHIVNVHGLESLREGSGVASALMDHLYAHYPHAMINHGSRTEDGIDWWNSYQEPDPDRNIHNLPPHKWDQFVDPHDVADTIREHELSSPGHHSNDHDVDWALDEDDHHYASLTAADTGGMSSGGLGGMTSGGVSSADGREGSAQDGENDGHVAWDPGEYNNALYHDWRIASINHGDDEDSRVYLRFGDWPDDERSYNNVMGGKEDGVSVYDLDHHGNPMDPDPHMQRGVHNHEDYGCEDGECDIPEFDDNFGNDTRKEMQGRVMRAERNRRNGRDFKGETGHLVKGKLTSFGHDDEPLLTNVRKVGDWIDHRHHFIKGAEPHELARHPEHEDYEPYEGEPQQLKLFEAAIFAQARSINGTEIDHHGTAPDEIRATHPNSYDQRSTEGEPDPDWLDDIEDRRKAMAHLTMGPSPDDHHGLARHLIDHHGYTVDQLSSAPDTGQDDGLNMLHEMDHDAFDEGVSGEFGSGKGTKVPHDHKGTKVHDRFPVSTQWNHYGPPQGQYLSHLITQAGEVWRDPHDNTTDELRQHLINHHGEHPDYIGGDVDDHHYDLHNPNEDAWDFEEPNHEHHELRDFSPSRWEGDERKGGATQSENRRDTALFGTEEFTPRPYSLSMLIATAASDPEFRFHVTAAWRDVQKKAVRIRKAGGVQITHVSEGMIVANVKGDHHVYETGLQRVPGRRQAVAVYSCGCKWGAYHWGAEDDLSRFAGRMCSHALALQYEAQSRGMFGRDISMDDTKPRWVPSKVVVKYDIEDGKNIMATAKVVPEQSPWMIVLASANDLFGDGYPVHYSEPSYPNPLGPTAPMNPDISPTSAGPFATSEPNNWGSITGPTMMPSRTASEGPEATLHEEPEGALPSTDGEEHTAAIVDLGSDADLTGGGGIGSIEGMPGDALNPDYMSMQTQGSADDVVAQFQRSAAGTSLMAGSGNRPESAGMDIAGAAKAHLAKVAASQFTAGERDALINESPGVQASNTDRLDIKGTHYAELEKQGEDDDLLWMM